MRFVFSKEEDKQDAQPVFRTLCDIFMQFFGVQLLFDMFSTLISLEVRLN